MPLGKLSGFAFRLIVLAIYFMVPGCGDDDPPQKTSADATTEAITESTAGGTAIVAIHADPGILNPLLQSSALAGYVVSEMQDTLVELNESLVYEPRIATSWEVSPDGLAVTFHLQPWKWSDGEPLTAYDVKTSFDLFKNPLIGSPRAGDLEGVLRAVLVDSVTIRYEFDQPYPDILSKTVHSLLPAHITDFLDAEMVGSWSLNQQPISSGAFMLESWRHNRSLNLARNPFYSLSEPMLDRVIFKIIPETDAQVLALETGEVDMVSNIPPHLAERLASNPDLKIQEVRGRLFYFLTWNFSNPLFEDARVRQALSLALDRQRMIDALLSGFGQTAFGPLPPGIWNHHPDLHADSFDPVKARQILEAAGWIDRDGDGIREKDGVKFSFEILARSGDPFREQGGVILRENFKAVGVEVGLITMEQSATFQRVEQGRFDAFFSRFRANVYGNPTSLIHSGSGDRFNSGKYANSQVDSLLSVAVRIVDPQESLPVWYEIQEILTRDQPAAYLVYPVNLVGSNRRVRNIRPHMLSPYNNLEQWWIAPEDRKYRSQ